MKQEYLILDNTQKNEIETFPINDDIEKKVEKYPNVDIWKVIYSIKGENENSARKLSSVQDEVIKKFKLTTLINESSEYFNKKLYPLVSAFERKLRKLLYLYNTLNPDGGSTKIIDDLEAKDFGEIFDMLFIDTNFIKKVKDIINNKKDYPFTKDGVLSIISELIEEPNWDKLLGKDTVPTLRKCFNDIRLYRNDVMHSHNIDYEKYNKIEDLYKKVNNELDSAIEQVDRTTILINISGKSNISLSQAFTSWEEQMRNIDYSRIVKAIETLNIVFDNAALIDALQKCCSNLNSSLVDTSENLEWSKQEEEDNNDESVKI